LGAEQTQKGRTVRFTDDNRYGSRPKDDKRQFSR
jgi:hypothetical protein